MLAIAVGTAHGAYKLPTQLDFQRIETIAKAIDIPLMLHCDSRLPDGDIKKAVEKGISKVNIFTDINIAAVEAKFSAFDSMSRGIIDLIVTAVKAIKAAIIRKLESLGSAGRLLRMSEIRSRSFRWW